MTKAFSSKIRKNNVWLYTTGVMQLKHSLRLGWDCGFPSLSPSLKLEAPHVHPPAWPTPLFSETKSCTEIKSRQHLESMFSTKHNPPRTSLHQLNLCISSPTSWQPFIHYQADLWSSLHPIPVKSRKSNRNDKICFLYAHTFQIGAKLNILEVARCVMSLDKW